MRNLETWAGCSAPALPPVEGRYARIEPVRWPDDAPRLFAAVGGAEKAGLWRHIPIGPFDDETALQTTLQTVAEEDNWRTHVIRAFDGGALGTASYMRIRPEHGSVEVGCIVLSEALQRTRAASEAMYLMARHVFDDLGYRRYEWKCNDANAASKRAAERFGFAFEGVFRQDMVMKGGNRDTAWFSILDSEWPRVKAAFEAWLDPENFDRGGVQRRSLAEIRRGL